MVNFFIPNNLLIHFLSQRGTKRSSSTQRHSIKSLYSCSIYSFSNKYHAISSSYTEKHPSCCSSQRYTTLFFLAKPLLADAAKNKGNRITRWFGFGKKEPPAAASPLSKAPATVSVFGTPLEALLQGSKVIILFFYFFY
jgi:hypothetical protein